MSSGNGWLGAYRDEQAREAHVADEARSILDSECRHHWHDYWGALWMVIPDGHISQACCKCTARRTIHAAHKDESPGDANRRG